MDRNELIKKKLTKQYKLSDNIEKDRFLLTDLQSKVMTINQFKVKNCKFCINKVCLLLKKPCMFYNRITGSNVNFYKCKYFKRTYANTEDEKIIKAFSNLLTNLWLIDFDKEKVGFKVTDTEIKFTYGDYSKSYSRQEAAYNNILSEIIDYLIEKYGICDKENGFRVLQVNHSQIKYEKGDEIFIYTITDYEVLKDLLSGKYDSSVILDYITSSLRFEKSTKLMDISKEMKMLYDTAHCYKLVCDTFKDILEFVITVSTLSDYKNITYVTDNKEEVSLHGLPIGGTLTQLHYLVSLLSTYGFLYRIEDLLVSLEQDEYKISFYKDKMPIISDLKVELPSGEKEE